MPSPNADRDPDNLLYGSETLTLEEECLREELLAWIQARLDLGARPIPLQAALVICANRMKQPDAYGLQVSPPRSPHTGYRGMFGKAPSNG